MTVKKLHKILSSMLRSGRGYMRVCVDKSKFNHALESDGCVIIDVNYAEVKCIYMLDDDGGTKILADGTESSRRFLVLSGEKDSND